MASEDGSAGARGRGATEAIPARTLAPATPVAAPPP
eukprot:CAMPEP_0180075272 /NCGR_PEP_ID=MMETSP0985-20121206/14410_1 /TAXON_ID=483367 /ORGANISM="non described non described, Strain CCMP 2436" /LENGTH=35 /DNA_ID= /DNA_START= /DNA_END= /DNA_ORIENTATION=